MGVITIIKPDGTTEYTVRPTHAYMGTCSTAAGTAAKAVTISPAIDNFLEAGVRITVYFSNANTASNPTLSINSGTAKAIYKGGSAITKSLLSVGYHDFIYDGTNWEYVSSYIDSTYTYLSASHTKTSTGYVVLGAGSNTGNFLRGDGTWQTPTGTTYATFTTSANGLVPASGTKTNSFLRGDGSWQTPSNTTYAALNSASSSNYQYVVPGVGNEIEAPHSILFGDGTWHDLGSIIPFKSRPYAIGEGLYYQNSTTIYYESSTGWNSSTQILYMKFRTDEENGDTTIDLSTLSNGNIYYFVFRDGIPNTGRLVATDSQNHAISFLINGDYFYYNSLPVFPTNIVVAFKKTTNGLEYVGLPQFQTLNSNSFSEGSYLVNGAGSNTGKFLRGDGSWQTPTDTTYVKLSSSNTNTAGSYTVPGAGSNTGKFLRGDGSWQTPTNTTYTTFTTAAAGLTPASGANTAKFLRGDGSWQTPTNTTYGAVTTSGAGLAPTLPGGTSSFLRGDGSWAVPPDNNTTYARISASNSTTNASYTVPGAGSNTGNFLRGDGTWQTPTNTTYSTVTTAAAGLAPAVTNTARFLRGDGTWQKPANTTYTTFTTADAGLAPASGSNTDKFLRGDGEWKTPADTTYAKLSSSDTNTAGSYVVKGAGSNTSYFLRGDGTWMPKCAVGGSENASSDTYHKIYYESSVTNNNGLLYIKFKDRDGATLAISTLVNGTIYNFVFRSDTPAQATRFALKDDTTASAVSFMTSEGNEVWFGGKTMPLIPTNMVLQFKKDSSGLKYVGPSNLYNMLSSTNSSETLGHVVKGAGANTGYFLRGDGTWQPVSGGGGGTYTTLNSNSLDTGQYVVKGLGMPAKASAFFLRADGEWDSVSNHVTIPSRLESYYIGEDVNNGTNQGIIYEYTRRDRGSNLEAVIFTTNFHDENTIYDISNFQSGQTYYIVFTHPVTVNKRLIAWDLNEQHEEISFVKNEINGAFIDYTTFSPFPTNIVLKFKRTNVSLVYLGPALPVLYSNASIDGSFMVPGAGSNTGLFLRGDGTWQTPTNTTYTHLSSTHTSTSTRYTVKGAGANTGYFLRGDGTWQPVSGGGGTSYDYISASNTSTNTSYVVRGAGANTDCFLRGDGYWGTMHEFTGATSTSDGISGIVPQPLTGEQYCALLGDGGWHTLPISNKIVQEFECEALENTSYPVAISFVASKMQNALGVAIENIYRYASTQEILFKFNGRMGFFDGQSDLMIIEILAVFHDIARLFLNDKYMEYHITVNFEFTPQNKYYENNVIIPAVSINNNNKLEIIETLDNDNNRTLNYDESSGILDIRELQAGFLNILTYRLDCHDVNLHANENRYSIGTQISLKQYAMVFHGYMPVVR